MRTLPEDPRELDVPPRWPLKVAKIILYLSLRTVVSVCRRGLSALRSAVGFIRRESVVANTKE